MTHFHLKMHLVSYFSLCDKALHLDKSRQFVGCSSWLERNALIRNIRRTERKYNSIPTWKNYTRLSITLRRPIIGASENVGPFERSIRKLREMRVPFEILPSVSRRGTLARLHGNEGPRRRIILSVNGASHAAPRPNEKYRRNATGRELASLLTWQFTTDGFARAKRGIIKIERHFRLFPRSSSQRFEKEIVRKRFTTRGKIKA